MAGPAVVSAALEADNEGFVRHDLACLIDGDEAIFVTRQLSGRLAGGALKLLLIDKSACIDCIVRSDLGTERSM